MNTNFLKRTISLLGFTVTWLALSGLSVQAETQLPATEALTIASLEGSDAAGSRSADDLMTESVILQEPTTASETSDALVAQATPVIPGRATRSGPSYIGIGGNIGIAGDTSASRSNFAIISKVGLTNNLSVRPSAVVGNNTTFFIPVTADFPVASATVPTNFTFAPYVGGGVAVSTGNNSRVGPMVAGGVDVPLSPQLTATAAANVGFLRETEVGVIVGVGYTFSGF